MQVKMLEDNKMNRLEKRVNEFISFPNIEVKDIKYTTAMSDSIGINYSVLIMFEPKK